MSTFRKYLKDTRQTLKSFATRMGYSGSYLSEIASGKKLPNLRLAHDISVATGGLVSMASWVKFQDQMNGNGNEHKSHIATNEDITTKGETKP